MFLLSALALLSEASGAEIQLMSNEPVTMEVNGRVVVNRPGERGATAADLAGGNHRVQIFDAQDRLVTSSTVPLTVQEQVRLELRRGQLTELGRGPLPPSGAATPCPEPAPPPALEPGSVQLTGVRADDMAMWVDGKPVRYGSGSFLATNLSAGYHDVRIVRGSATLFSGQMRVYPGLVRRCLPEAGALDCVFVESVVSLPPKAPAEKPVVVVAPPPPAAPLAMREAEFKSFLTALNAESFSENKLGVVKGVARNNWFTIAQVGVVLEALSFSADKIAAATLLEPRVIDRENAWKLSEGLTFSSDKEAVRKLFE